MKRRNLHILVTLLIGIMTLVSATAIAEKTKLTKENKTKKVMHMKHKLLGPGMLLAHAKKLELTEAQVKQLHVIMKEMSAKTKAVLTETQIAKLKTLKMNPHHTKKMKKGLVADHVKGKKTKGAGRTKAKVVKEN